MGHHNKHRAGGEHTPRFNLQLQPGFKGERGFSDAMTIRGKVRNDGDAAARYAHITFSLFNSAGEKVGSASGAINNLGAGQVWSFEAVGFGSGATRFQFDEITAFQIDGSRLD